ILAVTLVAIAGINANSFESSNYARSITVATMLARSKMIDIEMEVQKDGFTDSEKDYDGDFSEEGYESMKWEAIVRPIEVDVSKLLGPLLGGDTEVAGDKLPDQFKSMIAGLNGSSVEEVGGQNQQLGQVQDLLQNGGIELVFKQVGETLANSIREITLEIKWGRPGIDEESLKFVQYVTTTGRLSLAPSQLAPAGLTPDGRGSPTAVPPTLPGGAANPGRITPRFVPGNQGEVN
ncbi:MAG: hypothetical protein AAFN74_16350, partial [Myxococcota bacterium]